MTYLLGSIQAGAAKLGTFVGRTLGIVAQPRFTNAQRLEVARKAMIAADRSFAETTEYQLLTRIEKSRAVIGALVSHYEQTTSDTGFRYICNKPLVCLGAIFRYTRGTLSTSEQQVIKDQYEARFKIYLDHVQRTQSSFNLPTERLNTENIEDVIMKRKPFELLDKYIQFAQEKHGLTFRQFALLQANHGKDFSDTLLASKNRDLIGKIFDKNIHTQPKGFIKAMEEGYENMRKEEQNRSFFSRIVGAARDTIYGSEELPEGMLSEKDAIEILKLHRASEHTPAKLTEKFTNAFVAAIQEMIKEKGINQPSLDQIIDLLRNDDVIRKTFESYPLLNIFVRGYIEIGYKVLVNNIEYYLSLSGADKTKRDAGPSHSRKKLQNIFLSVEFTNKVRAHLVKEIDKQYVLDVVDSIAESAETAVRDALDGPIYKDEDYVSLMDVVKKGVVALACEGVVKGGKEGLRSGLRKVVESEYSGS